MVGQMLGDNVLPETIQEKRRKLRSKAQSIREPVRSTRENAVPGPDIVGRAENKFMSLRTRFVNRDKVLSRIRGRAQGSGSGSQSEDSAGETNSSGSTESSPSMV